MEHAEFLKKHIQKSYEKYKEVSDRGSSDSYSMVYTSKQGRMFDIREYYDGTFFLSELKPNGKCIRYRDEETNGRTSDNMEVWDDNRLLKLLDSPNDFAHKAEEIGINLEELVCLGSGLGVASIYYDSIEDVSESICRAINENKWYESVDHEKLNDPSFQEELKKTEAELREDYRNQLKNQHDTATQVEHGIFKGLHSMRGALSDDAKKRLLSFYNNPTEDNWDNVYSLCIKGGKTVWQAWLSVDPDAPRSKGGDNWDTIPDKEIFVAALRKAAGYDPFQDAEDKIDSDNDSTMKPTM